MDGGLAEQRPALTRRVARLVCRMPGNRWGKSVAGLTAVGALALALLLGASLLSRVLDHGPASTASASIQASVAFAAPAAGDLLQVTVLDTATGARRPLGRPDAYAAIEWSPDGAAIAALAPSSGAQNAPRVHILSVASGGDVEVELPPGADSAFLSWAPDASEVAVVGTRLHLLSVDGRILSEAAAPALAGDKGTAQVGGGYAWSPDSRYFAAIVNGSLVLMGRDGSVQTQALSDVGSWSDTLSVGLMGWNGPSLVLRDFTAPPEKALYELVAGPAGTTTRFLPPGVTPPVPQRAVAIVDDSLLREVASFMPGGLASPVKRSADGSADVFEVRPGPGAGVKQGDPAVTVVVRVRESGAALAVPDLAVDTRGGWLLDVYVRPVASPVP